MREVKFEIINYKDREIYHYDYKGMTPEEVIVSLKKAEKEFLRDQKKVIFVSDYSGLSITNEYVRAAKEFMKNTNHLIEKGAFLGINKIQKMILNSVVKAFGADLRAFDSMEEAKE